MLFLACISVIGVQGDWLSFSESSRVRRKSSRHPGNAGHQDFLAEINFFDPHPFPCLPDRTIFRCRALCSFGRIAKTEMPRGVGASANFIKNRTRRRARREFGQKRKVAATIGPFMLTFKPA